jgi:hypothetical protein
MSRMRTLFIDGHSLRLDDLAAFLAGGCVSATPAAWSACWRRPLRAWRRRRAALQHQHRLWQVRRVRVRAETRWAQHNLRSHSTASGPPLERDIVRLMMVLRRSLLADTRGVGRAWWADSRPRPPRHHARGTVRSVARAAIWRRWPTSRWR